MTQQPVMPAGGGGAVPGQLASYGERFLAYLIDVGVMIVIGIVFGVLNAIVVKIGLEFLAIILSLLQFAIQVAYFIVLWGVDNPITGRGQTIGKKVMKIKIVKTDGSDVGVVDAILRYVGYFISSIIVALGYIWIFIDENNQGWHDKIAKTYVIKAG